MFLIFFYYFFSIVCLSIFLFEYFLSHIEFVRCSASVFVLLRLETVDLIRTVDIHMLLAAAVYAFFLYGGLVLTCDLANRIQVFSRTPPLIVDVGIAHTYSPVPALNRFSFFF